MIAGGRAGFEAEIGFKPSSEAWPGRFYRALGIGGYVSAGAVVAAGLLAVPLSVVALSGVEWRWLLLLAILGLVPAIDVAVALVNRIVTWRFPRYPAAGAGTARRNPRGTCARSSPCRPS